MSKQDWPRVRNTPHARYLYTATLNDCATYGWGNSPDEARARLAEMIIKSGGTCASSLTSRSTTDQS
jgi:hypothetical protein